MRKLMIGAAVAATALGGTAVAFGDSSSKEIGDDGPTAAVAAGPPLAFAGGPGDTFARDLADELGVTTSEVKRALNAVAEKEMARHRQELAEEISSHLDGVSAEQVASALEVADRRMREAFESGDPPSPDLFTETLADELGLSEDEVSRALGAAREAEFNPHRKDARPMLDFHGEGKLAPPPLPPGPGISFGVAPG
jgi:hypothetical protein